MTLLTGHMGDSRRGFVESRSRQARGSGGAAIEERSDEMRLRPNRARRAGVASGGLGNSRLLKR